MSSRDLDKLEKKLGYHFQDKDFLHDALLHPSASKGQSLSRFERLEFLGDRVLGLVIAQWIFQVYPQNSEGDLARRHSVLVGRQPLAQVASLLDLKKHLLFDQDSRQKRSVETILSDTCEALIGACFLDGGLAAAERVIRTLWEPYIDAASAPPIETKSALQEWSQRKGKPVPSYVVLSVTGPDHNPEYVVAVHVQGLQDFTGTGYSKQEAEKRAAQCALNFIREQEQPL